MRSQSSPPFNKHIWADGLGRGPRHRSFDAVLAGSNLPSRKRYHCGYQPEPYVSAADSLREHRLTPQLPLHVLKHVIDIFLDGSLDDQRI